MFLYIFWKMSRSVPIFASIFRRSRQVQSVFRLLTDTRIKMLNQTAPHFPPFGPKRPPFAMVSETGSAVSLATLFGLIFWPNFSPAFCNFGTEFRPHVYLLLMCVASMFWTCLFDCFCFYGFKDSQSSEFYICVPSIS